jgi:2-polyprenyl-6-methoxyphenol hydroxylase-like FAD-dependent oxidoreductase
MAGLGAALALGRADREIIVVDRDPPVPEGDIDEVFDNWERRGATQLRHSHVFLATLYNLIREKHPRLHNALEEAGAQELTFEMGLPHTLRSRYKPAPGDEEMVFLSSRRTTLEYVIRQYAEKEAGATFICNANVSALLFDEADKRRVVGAHIKKDGATEELKADLVIDAMGRSSPAPAWFAERDEPISSEVSDAGILYYTRHYRFNPGQEEPPRGTKSANGDLGYLKYGVFPGDNGCFSLTLAVPEIETEMQRIILDPDTFDEILKQLPGPALWTDAVRAKPTSRVFAMGNLKNEWRNYVEEGRPHALNFFALGDALIRTNPLYGRGCSSGVLQAHFLADILDEMSDPIERARAFDKRISNKIRPYFDAMARQDKSAIKRAEAERDPNHKPSFRGRLMRSFVDDAINPSARAYVPVLRGALRGLHMLDHPENWIRQPGILARILLMWATPKPLKARYYTGPIGPDRATLFKLLNIKESRPA